MRRKRIDLSTIILIVSCLQKIDQDRVVMRHITDQLVGKSGRARVCSLRVCVCVCARVSVEVIDVCHDASPRMVMCISDNSEAKGKESSEKQVTSTGRSTSRRTSNGASQRRHSQSQGRLVTIQRPRTPSPPLISFFSLCLLLLLNFFPPPFFFWNFVRPCGMYDCCRCP